MTRPPTRTSFTHPLARVGFVLLLLLGLLVVPTPAFAAAGPCLAEGWSIDGLLNSVSTTTLIQLGLIGGCIALYIMFRSKGT